MLVERIIPDEYASNDRVLTESVERYDLAASLLRPDDIVIEAACGAGYGSAMLAKKCSYVYSYDNSPEAIAYAVERYAGDNIEFTVLDLDQAVLSACDVLVSFETIEHLLHPKIFLDKAKSVAGRLIMVSTPIVPTQDLNPFHLHDFDKELVEELMRPWQPAYFCIQAGAGNVLNGIWVFQKADAIANAEDQRLVSLNLYHQQAQVLHLYDSLQRVQAWVQELERGKAWLDEERGKWIYKAEHHVQLLQEQQARSHELDEQLGNWQRTAQAQGRYLEALQSRGLFRILARFGLLPSFLSEVDK